MSELGARLARYAAMAEAALEDAVPMPGCEWPERGIPAQLAEAMRYSLLGGGKRLRPALLLAAYEALRDDVDEALPFCAALEMVHAYSLIHDDLPAMDNDDLRRGKPTSHKVFGEAMAILAGDALLNLAFETMAHSRHPRALDALRIVAARAGSRGMIAGQAADMLSQGRAPDPGMVRYIHLRTTADLLTAAVTAGLALGGAGDEQLRAGEEYGRNLGLAFQITDDLLDLTGDAATLGKAAGKDEAEGKMTWPAAVGRAQAEADAQAFAEAAANAAGAFGRMEGFFAALARSVPQRVK
ncbi:MAG TPA: farnesyl diphosphate synthase [Candidatus Limnocylindria bacterium]|nr:farnesyl diphosphate synthase [Candidatus Limnocylindria bacterium]